MRQYLTILLFSALSFFTSVQVHAFGATTGVNNKAALDGILNGIEFTEGEFNDWEDLNPNFDIQKCLEEFVGEYVDFAVGKAGGPILKRLKILATTNPKLFIRGIRKLQKDAPEISNEVWDALKKAYKEAGSEFKPAALLMDIETWYSKPLQSYLENGLTQLERNLALPNASSSLSFNNTVKDVAFEIHNKMDMGETDILNLGANITMSQGNKNIRIPLLGKLKTGAYKMVLVIDNEIEIENLESLLKKLSPERQEFINGVIKGNNVSLSGANAKDYFKGSAVDNIKVDEIDVYTKNADGTIVKKEFKELANAGSEIFSSFSKTIDFGGDIVKNTNKKLNILGRVNPKNGTIGTSKLKNELIAKGVSENEITCLLKPMPKGVDANGFNWDNLTVIGQNTKYWNDFNKVHIDDIIANGGDIRFIQDPRLPANQFNRVSDMLNGPFKTKCLNEGLVKIMTFMKMEYDYLLSKGYVLQENGLMIKP